MLRTKIIVLFTLIALSVFTLGCEKEGDAEKAGKKIDEVFNVVKDKIDDVRE